MTLSGISDPCNLVIDKNKGNDRILIYANLR